MESITTPVKHALANLPGGETAVKTVELAEEKGNPTTHVKQVVQAIPVVGKNEKVKSFMGIHDQGEETQHHQQEAPHEMSSEITQKLQEAHITPIEPSEQRPQTIGERVKPVLAGVIPASIGSMVPGSIKNMMGMGTGTGTGTSPGPAGSMEQKQPTYMDKITHHMEYFANEIKEKQNGRIYARALLKGRGNIVGDLTFGSDLNTGETCMVGTVMGLPPGPHALNIHEFGDLSQGHSTIGSHFNPFHSLKHGVPTDRERHLGDIGNITAGADGSADVDVRDLDLPLVGPFSIIGRAIEIHAAGDKQGVPACDCPLGCECRISSGSRCPRAHKCAMCSEMKKMGEPIAIGIIVHCPEIKEQQQIKMEVFTKPWESLRGTSD